MSDYIEVRGQAEDIHTIELAFGELTEGLNGFPMFRTNGKELTLLTISCLSGFGPQLLPKFQERINKLPLRGKVALNLKN